MPLGLTDDQHYGRRILHLLAAFPTVWQHRSFLRAADIIYARNIDMLMIAFAAKKLARAKAPLVYEALDVHPAFTKAGWKGRALRFIERTLLRASRLLVVSSPLFIERYFNPIQKFSGPWFLLENKLHASDWDKHPIPRKRERAGGAPWVIGWFGVIRCQRSLDILQNIAARFPDRVVVHIRGLPSETDGITDNLLRGIASRSRNIFYFGTYRNPRDLAEIYGAVDLAWAVDFSASGANSDWLIPNRLYECGIFGVPAIARKDTATGEIVEQDLRGWCLDEPFDDSLDTFIHQFDSARLSGMAEKLCSKDLSTFVDVHDTLNLMRQMQRIAGGGLPPADASQVSST